MGGSTFICHSDCGWMHNNHCQITILYCGHKLAIFIAFMHIVDESWHIVHVC